MTLPASGAISFNSINVELGVAGTTLANINQASYRTLAGVPSGAIALSNFYGKSNKISVSATISANSTNYTLNPAAVSGYSAGKSNVTLTINSGIYVYSTATGTPAINVTGFTAGDTVTIVNNGYIMGMGGRGSDYSTNNVTSGGNAISLAFNSSIINNSYIGGGGGGGGCDASGGGGGGGGAGGGAGGTAAYSLAGGAGGGPGAAGGNGQFGVISSGKDSNGYGGGGGGGRIMPGVGGGAVTYTSTPGGGAGGAGGASDLNTQTTPGGSAGNAGSSGGGLNGGGGGGWGAPGGASSFAGGTGGKAISLNGYTATRSGGGTTYGLVS